MAQIAYQEDVDGDYRRYFQVRELDSSALRKAKQIFVDYKKRGIVINGNFDDMSWTLSNEAKNVGLTMLTFDGGVNKLAMKWIGCTYPQYVKFVKAYIVFSFGDICINTMRNIANTFNKLPALSSAEVLERTKDIHHILAFLEVLPGYSEERDYVISELEERLEQRGSAIYKSNTRQLADFMSYLRFNEVLNDFWRRADNREKLFFFPLYFWWNITAILPLRPTEFLLTPRDCLHTQGGEHILTIRRTKLKGGHEKIGYRISQDYILKEYAINEALAWELRNYLDATESMKRTELNTLFLQEPHWAYLGRKALGSRYYTHSYLTTCMKYFYKSVIEAHNHEISRIRPGDTRHLAMVNLIISGGSPVICRDLAGHSDIDISSRYYSNISNLVECATRERFIKSKGRYDVTGTAYYPLKTPTDMRKVTGGFCSSSVMANGSIDDCLAVFGDKSHAGECSRCRHYHPNNPGMVLSFHDERTGKEQVDADSKFLISMIELVRRGLGHQEDIVSALLRLQHSTDHYSRCLWEKFSHEGNRYGKTKEN